LHPAAGWWRDVTNSPVGEGLGGGLFCGGGQPQVKRLIDGIYLFINIPGETVQLACDTNAITI